MEWQSILTNVLNSASLLLIGLYLFPCSHITFIATFLPEWFDFIGQRAELGFPGSPYAMNFRLTLPDPSQMELMNVSVYSCGDTSLGCSCGDCPSSLACSDIEPPSPDRRYSCFLRIGSFKVGWHSFAILIYYISQFNDYTCNVLRKIIIIVK